MQFKDHHKYDAIMELTSSDIAVVLHEIKVIIESRLQYAASNTDENNINEDIGAIDKNYLLHKKKLDTYISAVDLLIKELTLLGHKLTPIDQDIDLNFEASSISWITVHEDWQAFGLDIEFFPNKANVRWVLSTEGQ